MSKRVLPRQIKLGLKAKLVIFGNVSAANKYADLVVNSVVGTSFVNRRFVDKETNTLYLCGPKYLVLRKDFYELTKNGFVTKGEIKNILLVFGGSDPSNLTSKVLEKLLGYGGVWRINVLLGIKYPFFDVLNRTIEKYSVDKNVSVYRDVKNVAQFMYEADLVITSPGLSMFEAFFLKTPVLLIYQNIYQKSEFGGLVHAFDENVISRLNELMTNADELHKNDSIVKNLKIGLGKQEIVHAILEEL